MSGRIRTVKPEWAEDELISMATSDARVLSVLLLLFADDHGNGRAGPENLMALKCFPRCSESYRPAMQELVDIGYVRLYEVGRQKYFSVVNWRKHQKVDKPSGPRVPLPPDSRDPRETLANPREDVEKPREVLATGDKMARDASDGGSRTLARDSRGIPTPTPTTTTRESTLALAPVSDELVEHTVSASDAKALVDHWQAARFKRGEPQKATIASMWMHSAKTIIAMAGGDLDEAKRVVDAYVGGENEYWAAKKWPLSLLAKPRDFEEAHLLVGVDDKPKAKRGGFDMSRYDAQLAAEMAEIEAQNRAEEAARGAR